MVRTLAAVPSVNALAAELVDDLVRDAPSLRIGISRGSLGERLIDAGSAHLGGFEAGLRIACICMGGLGATSLSPDTSLRWPWRVVVRSSHPVLACLASQYAGWRLSEGEGKPLFGLGSGPGRALARAEPIFDKLDYEDPLRDDPEIRATLVIEGHSPPPEPLVAQVATACRVAPDRLTFIHAPTQSLAGCAQIVARVLEVALHKAHELQFPLDRIQDGMGVAPLCPPHPDFVTAMERTNDAIIYGGGVQLFVSGPADDAHDLAMRLPSRTSRDYGEPFSAIFKRFNGNFYDIDPMLFSPAEAIITATETGQSFHAGGHDSDLLDASFR